MKTKEIILDYFDGNLKAILNNLPDNFFDNLEEIRIRVRQPIILKKTICYSIDDWGKLSKNLENGYLIDIQDIKKIIDKISKFSLYAFEEELKSGYITIQGGHRIGICGKVVLEDQKVKTIKDISSINIRISHQILNCSDHIIKYISNKDFLHTMIISPPACGKTTLLRDIIRNISDGFGDFLMGQNVGVVDERSEISATYKGISQNYLGKRTDILDSCPKAIGMKMLLRSMSPRVIAVDEIGSKEDIFAIEDIINAGIKILCTVHGKNLEDIKKIPNLSELLKKNIFNRFIILGYSQKPGFIQSILDENFVELTKHN